MPGGKSYFNSTGNAGMAKGGSGDVLTGILTALLGQSYSPGEAACWASICMGWPVTLPPADLVAGKYAAHRPDRSPG
jgi:NAD(P)H-hydrate repair Nnr-like enzyme with NAD(P)H-hydrate dehydratase domain